MDPSFRSILNSFGFRVAVALLGCLVFLRVLNASDQKQKYPPVSSTFLSKPVEAFVARGASVFIPVDVIALPGEKISLQITAPPESGSLKVVPGTGTSKIALLYHSDAGRKVSRETFTFRIRAGTRAWITSIGAVTINDRPGKLEFDVPELDFGEIPAGSISRRPLKLRNVSGYPVTGRLDPRSPHWVEGDASFSLKEGEEKEFFLDFKPLFPGDNSSLLGSDPFLENFPVIALKGRAREPFHVDQVVEKSGSGRSSVDVVLRNPEDHSLTLNCSADGELSLPSTLTLDATGSATLSIDTSRVAVPLESARTLHATLAIGDYRKTLDIRIKGRDGQVVARICDQGTTISTTADTPVRLKARLINESHSPRTVQWQLQGDGNVLEGTANGSLLLQGGESKEISFLWQPARVGHLFPRLLLMPADPSTGPVAWEIDCRAPRIDPPSPVKPPIPPGPGGGDGVRPPSPIERERMVILHPPVIEGSFYPRYLVLSWSYQGSGKVDFSIEEKSSYSGMSDRTGESDEGWRAIHPKYVVTGTQCIWAVRIPVYFTGTREFRIYPAGDGERILANTVISLTREMVFGPLIKVLSVVGVILLGILLLRMRINRRSGG